MNEFIYFIMLVGPWYVYLLLREPKPKWKKQPDSEGWWWVRFTEAGDAQLYQVVKCGDEFRVAYREGYLGSTKPFSNQWQKAVPYNP